MIISRLIVPNSSLNIAEKTKIDTNPGTAHGKIKIVRIVFLNFTLLSFARIAKNRPNAIWNVVATSVQIIVHEKTLINVFFQSGTVRRFLKLSKPIQSTKCLGGELYRS